MQLMQFGYSRDGAHITSTLIAHVHSSAAPLPPHIGDSFSYTSACGCNAFYDSFQPRKGVTRAAVRLIDCRLLT